MNRKIIYLLLGAIVLVGFYFSFINYRNDTDRLFARLKTQLREEKFEEIYDESDEGVHLNVSKEVFVERMKDTVEKLKQIDGNLNFKRDREREMELHPEGRDNTYGFLILQKLENENESVEVFVSWFNKGVFPQFSDISINSNNELSKKYQTVGVSYGKLIYK